MWWISNLKFCRLLLPFKNYFWTRGSLQLWKGRPEMSAWQCMAFQEHVIKRAHLSSCHVHYTYLFQPVISCSEKCQSKNASEIVAHCSSIVLWTPSHSKRAVELYCVNCTHSPIHIFHLWVLQPYFKTPCWKTAEVHYIPEVSTGQCLSQQYRGWMNVSPIWWIAPEAPFYLRSLHSIAGERGPSIMPQFGRREMGYSHAVFSLSISMLLLIMRTELAHNRQLQIRLQSEVKNYC